MVLDPPIAPFLFNKETHHLLAGCVAGASLPLEGGEVHSTPPHVGCVVAGRGAGEGLSRVEGDGVDRPAVPYVLHENTARVHLPQTRCTICNLGEECMVGRTPQ